MKWADVAAKAGKLGKGALGLATGSSAVKFYLILGGAIAAYAAGVATIAWHDRQIEQVRKLAYEQGLEVKQREWNEAAATAKSKQETNNETATSKFEDKQVKREKVYIKKIEEVIKYEPDPSRGCSYDPDFVRRFNAQSAEPTGAPATTQGQ